MPSEEARAAGSPSDLFVARIYDRKRPERPYSELEFPEYGWTSPVAGARDDMHEQFLSPHVAAGATDV